MTTDQQLADSRARFECSTHPGWRDSTDVGRLLAELGRVRAELTTTQARIDAVLALNFADEDELEQMDPEDYHRADGYGDAINEVQRLLCPAAAVPSA